MVHYGPPREAVEAARTALGRPGTHEYHDVAGLPRLRALIAAKLASENHIEADWATEVMVTAGANMAFMHAVLATTSPGDLTGGERRR